MIYFDNAATTYPKPEAVREAMNEAFTRYGANPGRSGHRMSVETAECIYETRELAARMFGAPGPEDVIFTQNCTQALNQAIQGILQPGDHVIISDLEHNSVIRPLQALGMRGVISYDVADTGRTPQDCLAGFERMFRPNTRLVCCTQASNVFGIRLPVESLARLAHRHGAYMLVDAAQSAGVVEIDITASGIDFLCIAAHKGLYGPVACGMLITPLGERLAPLMQGGTGSLSLQLEQPAFLPDRLESGTLGTMGILGLRAGMELVQRQGIPNIYRHEMAITNRMWEGLARMERVLLYNRPQMPVFSFNLEGKTGEETAALLSEKGFALRGGYHCSPLAHQKMGTLEIGAARVSTGLFNTLQQAELFCEAVRSLA